MTSQSSMLRLRPPFYKRGNGGTQHLSNFPKVTWLGSGRVGIWTHVSDHRATLFIISLHVIWWCHSWGHPILLSKQGMRVDPGFRNKIELHWQDSLDNSIKFWGSKLLVGRQHIQKEIELAQISSGTCQMRNVFILSSLIKCVPTITAILYLVPFVCQTLTCLILLTILRSSL